MSLKFAILASLLEGEFSGYDLAKSFDASVANFWQTTPQQLYRELERLSAEGMIAARVVEQERRPNKRVFRLTADGRRALHEFTATPVQPTTIRDDLLVKVQGSDAGDAEAVLAAVEERMEWSRAKLARFERLRERMLDGRSESDYLRENDRVGPYLTLLRGISFEKENLQWGEHAARILRQRAESGVSRPA
ncbi:PadR family transcriptional regulator [Amycolatopsis sp. AA4]|uniref:PadR family transcriptional regulator n=1 Tax=Actinomycetes TaxID=1760 RepID=UPI0001B55075|nr:MULTISPECIES: PadR family transcriptional regulator [Actinomycetes]ATY12589.1 PadR family transcriptional regulator [Amycolatopsis sp. AA4]EFL08381.1 transcriptional regulator [Streptomyces sp. AA4]